ncbi:chymotrypsin BI-like [Schistocerca cancellata]|uniref:chymotrypsin BI-like n=1 Tax=Schistocerca cancellata TaxID=274614 RepID=UPI0021190F36|nr:chymotrypsin BI-like [Schistocerca cancellata]
MDVSVVYSLVPALLVVMANGDSWAAPERGIFRIVGGKNATRCQFAHQALVQSDEKTVCGGSLITQTIVLTAAGCTVGFKKLTIRLGTNQRTQKDTNTWTAVSTWSKAHPDYDFDGHSEDDVALAFLPEKAPLGGELSKNKVAFLFYTQSIRKTEGECVVIEQNPDPSRLRKHCMLF